MHNADGVAGGVSCCIFGMVLTVRCDVVAVSQTEDFASSQMAVRVGVK